MVVILSVPAARMTVAVSVHSLQLLRPMNISSVVYLLLRPALWHPTGNAINLSHYIKPSVI